LNEEPANIYLPQPAIIRDILMENSQIKTFVLAFADKDYNRSFTYKPGQFMMVSVPHCGEAPISFSSSPSRPGTIQLSIRRTGKLTNAIHDLQRGSVIGLRGPYGRPFPMDLLKKKNLIFVAGGIGLAPLRSVITFCLDRGGNYGHKTILYGCRAPDELAFAADFATWDKRDDVTCLLTVDTAAPGWNGAVGVVTGLLDTIDLEAATSAALVCGPPIMIRFTLAKLSALGLADEDIITTMERQMKCGVGICQHCHMDNKLVCIDGPVFSRAELKQLRVMELKP
jgi:NAD(P)H-flavin reductase